MPDRRTSFTNVISLLGALVVTSVVLGLLGAGLMMPTVAATGAAAKQGVKVFDDLPGEFTQNPLSEQSRILASDGTLIATPYDENRVIVPLSQIAPVMRQAQIAIEDNRFYEHGGVDPQGVGRALVSNLRGGDTQGASTLTQQYVKITLQENALRNDNVAAAKAATAKNYTRKLQELKYAVTLEKTLTKNQILQGYLNLVYYGGQAYGVEAASRHFFGVKASQLTLPQAATLAGLVQLPSQTDPIRSPARAVARRNVVLDRMHTLKLISDNAWSQARASRMVLNPKPAQNSCALSPYPYFCDYIKEWLLWQPALGKTRAERQKRVNRGGLTIQTTLDPKIQKTARQELVKKVPQGNRDRIGAAVAIVEPGTGNVLAMAQNTTYAIQTGRGKEAVNWAVDAKYGGSIGFAFGSTAKMFAVAEALRSGRPIDSTVVARKADATHPAIFTRADFAKDDDCKIGAGQTWKVRNDEGTRNGRISLTDATAFSVNTAFAGLVSELGACKVRDMMTNLGLHQGSGKPIKSLPSPITLGSDSVAPLTLASAYATIASGGTYCEPTPVLAITTSDKKPLALSKSRCRRAVSPEVANGVTQILKTVLTKGTASGVGGLAGGRPAAGKTGTSDGSNETWFVGYTPQLAIAVWVGTPTGDPKRVLRNLHLGNTTYGGQIFGATIAAPIWKQVMDRASAGMPFLEFDSPSSKTQSGDVIPIPDVTGLTVRDAKSALATAGFRPIVGGSVSSSNTIGTVVSTSPSLKALRGSEIVLTTSAGYVPPPPVAPAKAPVAKAPVTNAPAQPPQVKLPKCRPGGPTPCRR
ncbi:MAG: penicillin-binding protein [Dermatophilaceae bacterium]|nr:penicillin-binding protein [Dermatophilaceae bacterium]